MPRKHQNWDDYIGSKLRDPEHAKLYLETALEEFHDDRDRGALLCAIRNVANAQGGLEQLSERTQLKVERLLEILSGERETQFDALESILAGLGFRIALAPLAPA